MGIMVEEHAALIDSIQSLREEVARLSQRIAALENRPAATVAPPIARASSKAQQIPEPISEEIVMVISAAIAAYLGVKPHLRQIRLINKNPWGLQGRVTIQASHALASYHG